MTKGWYIHSLSAKEHSFTFAFQDCKSSIETSNWRDYLRLFLSHNSGLRSLGKNWCCILDSQKIFHIQICYLYQSLTAMCAATVIIKQKTLTYPSKCAWKHENGSGCTCPQKELRIIQTYRQKTNTSALTPGFHIEMLRPILMFI